MHCLRNAVSLALVLTMTLAGCLRTLDRQLVEPDQYKTLDGESPYLKVHGRDGRTHVLSDWSVDEETQTVHGTGELLDTSRQAVEAGSFAIAIESVALFETNTTRVSGSAAGMAVLSGISAIVTVACLSNPKACFGSCPTFYTRDGREWVLRAEGFSSSIAPSLEASDVDALHGVVAEGRTFDVQMRNEALETHVVRYADLLLAERPTGGRVFATTGGTFVQTLRALEPSSAIADEGDILDAVRQPDGHERFTPTDSTDLAAREMVEIEFTHVEPGDYGLVLGSRQTLVSTYLLYQMLAYMGRSAVRSMADLERGDSWIRERLRATGRALGAIEIHVADADGNWVKAGETAETGPLATDVRLVPIPVAAADGSVRVRLHMTRGYWRIDSVQLAKLVGSVEPQRLQPVRVTRNGAPDDGALARLLDPDAALVTFPNDEYTLTYALPSDASRHELFFESRGYYLEWMREEWLAEENPQRAAEFFINPDAALKRMAPEFKQVEANMEAMFWGSRYNGAAIVRTEGARDVR